MQICNIFFFKDVNEISLVCLFEKNYENNPLCLFVCLTRIADKLSKKALPLQEGLLVAVETYKGGPLHEEASIIY